jgi:hypothetical protein
MQTAHYVFRELTSPTDLRTSFALRYAVYSKTPGLCTLTSLDPRSRLDVDAFDRFSRHFGMFEESTNNKRLLGCARVAGLEPGPYVEAAREALAEAPCALRKLEHEPACLLPATSYSAVRGHLLTLIDRCRGLGESVVEAGRFVFLPEVRTLGRRYSLWLARDFVAAVTAQFFLLDRVSNALINCSGHHRHFYSPFGFRVAGDWAVHPEPMLGRPVSAELHGRPEWLSGKARDLCARLAAELLSSGAATLAVSESEGARLPLAA